MVPRHSTILVPRHSKNNKLVRACLWHATCYTNCVISNPLSGQFSEEIEQIAQQLMQYLDLNAAAKDTREGIAKWWISRQRIEESLKAVDAALALLIARGEVVEITLADGTKVYGRR